MHALTFEIKKIHLGVVGFGKRLLADVPGMTPARFDLLFAIKSGGGGRMLRQSELREALGLHVSTVSKMITRLVALGWVVRDAAYGDRRERVVRLTAEGHDAIKLAMRIVMKRRLLHRWFRPIFLPYTHRHRCAERRTLDALASFFIICEEIASRLGRGPTAIAWPPPYDAD